MCVILSKTSGFIGPCYCVNVPVICCYVLEVSGFDLVIH